MARKRALIKGTTEWSAPVFRIERKAWTTHLSTTSVPKIMDDVLLDVGSVTCSAFMGDMHIFGRNLEEHSERLREVSNCARGASDLEPRKMSM
jgi:hypothetical protein